MLRNPPKWWYREPGAIAKVLAPFAACYGTGVKIRWQWARPYTCSLPIICIGNFTTGGAGKTPTALAIAEILHALGEKPVFLSRGYRGRTVGPYLLKTGDTSRHVGDEPLLLATMAPVVIAKNRHSGARFIEENTDASVIVMDDGLQNPLLRKDLSLAVIDASSGIGNGRVIPAGPLRAPVGFQFGITDGLIINGETELDDETVKNFKALGKPLLNARTVPTGDITWLAGVRVLAYSGIARPEKFFKSLEDSGAVIEKKFTFPDHHFFTPAETDKILRHAMDKSLIPVTTRKDFVRLADEGTGAKLKSISRTLDIKIRFEAPESIYKLLGHVFKS
jgi:tetraacyldisaccharide 4'-kinase